jgi:hypothetical protein
MWSAIHRDGEPKGRAGVVEAEEGQHTVDVDEQNGDLILHLDGAR